MNQKRYILATDYKYLLFSAIFSFEAVEDVFLKMDKQDLLHSYMACKIILSFGEDYETSFSQPYFLESTKSTVKKVIDSIKKQSGLHFEEKIKKSFAKIEEDFPAETKWINELLKDDSGIVSTSFFVPQILNSLVQEHDVSDEKRVPHIVSVNLTQIAGSAGNPYYATLTDIADCIRDDKTVRNKKRAKINQENTLATIKQVIQLHLVSNGEFQQYAKERSKLEDTQAKEGETSEEPSSWCNPNNSYPQKERQAEEGRTDPSG